MSTFTVGVKSYFRRHIKLALYIISKIIMFRSWFFLFVFLSTRQFTPDQIIVKSNFPEVMVLFRFSYHTLLLTLP